MATSRSTTEFILDQLSAVPNVRVRKMFGEYALYCDEKVVALICDDQLFVKTVRDRIQFADLRRGSSCRQLHRTRATVAPYGQR